MANQINKLKNTLPKSLAIDILFDFKRLTDFLYEVFEYLAFTELPMLPDSAGSSLKIIKTIFPCYDEQIGRSPSN